MGQVTDNLIIESGSITSENVGVGRGCGRCPSGCRTSCMRAKMIDYDVVEGEMDDFELAEIKVDYGSFRNSVKSS